MTLEQVLQPDPVSLEAGTSGVLEWFRSRRDQHPKHDVLALLGKGAMGEVLVARDRDLHRMVALKRIDSKRVTGEFDLRRFYTEAQITAQLDHPSIVPVHDIELDDEGRLSYSMKLVRGITLTDYIEDTRQQIAERGAPRERHTLPARLEIFLSVCAAISYAHSRRILHRDLKPDNIMLGAYHEVLVMDWGIAKLLGTPLSDARGVERTALLDSPTQTSEGSILGTPLYMSPEQARGENDRLGPASDQASLGLILYELVSLRRAYKGISATEIVMMASEGKKRPLERAQHKVPRELKAIIHKATAQSPYERYPSVQDLANDVRRYLQNEEVHAIPDNPIHRLSRWLSTHRGYSLALLSTLLFAAIVAVLGQFLASELALKRERAASRQRSAQQASWVELAASRAEVVNAAIEHWEAQLTGMAYAAQVALTQAPREGTEIYDCSKPATAPDDLDDSAVFFKPVSATSLCVEAAPGTDEAALVGDMRRLMGLSPIFRRARLVSERYDAERLDAAAQADLIRNTRLPILFSYLGTPDGIMATFPGRDTARDDYDPRERPWYRRASEGHAPMWMAIDSITRRSGLVLTGAMPVRAPQDDALLAVAAIDVEFSTIIDRLLAPTPRMPQDVEIYLVDEAGGVVVQSSMRAVAERLRHMEAPPFPYPELGKRFAQETAGSGASGRGAERRFVAWSRVAATNWTYVVAGPYTRMVGDDGRGREN